MRGLLPEERIRAFLALFPGKTKEEVEQRLETGLKRKLIRIIPAVLVLLTGAIWVACGEKRGREAQRILRPEAGSADKIQKVQVETADGWREIEIPVAALELSEEQIEELQAEAEEYLDIVIAADNESLQRITTDLYFPEMVSDTFKINWSTDVPWLLDSKGQVHNENLAEERAVTVTARIDYGTEFRVYERRVVLYPKVYTQEEAVLHGITEELVRLEGESRFREEISLPSVIDGRNIRLSQGEGLSISVYLGVLAVLLPVFVYHNYFSKLEKEKKKQEEQARNGYAEFATKLSLVLMAGVSVREAFLRLSKEYAKTYGEDYILTKELKVTCRELSNGCPEAVAYEAFGNRFGQVPYQRMASLLSQNVTKGVQNIRELLLHEAKEVMAEERTKIKVRGEQAGTKLLLPMMGFLILIFAILLVPAFRML